MAKRGGGKKSSPEAAYKKGLSHARETEKLLVENFVSLQKVLVNLSGKFDELTRQISELLKLFEDSAKVIVRNEMEKKKEDRGDKQILDTMISILDQNKVIAKGLTLMYESMGKSESSVKSFAIPLKKEEPVEKRKLVKEEKGYSLSRVGNTFEGAPYER
ncbi:hypothetical protein J4411_00270 [Candidatus Pacearchaeota archaeon]|nr:hypothetical protein [Candidatus Pacearchaeota archaeon]